MSNATIHNFFPNKRKNLLKLKLCCGKKTIKVYWHLLSYRTRTFDDVKVMHCYKIVGDFVEIIWNTKNSKISILNRKYLLQFNNT